MSINNNKVYIREVLLKKDADKFNCTGCSVCYNICKQDAIKMCNDDKGFFYPVIDFEKCIFCEQCYKNCPYYSSLDQKALNNSIKVFAVKNKTNSIIMKSSSGGVFYEIAMFIIKNKGVVYGAVFNQEFEVVHDRIVNESDIVKGMGSKYVQSRIDLIYRQVKVDLKENKYVLFTGTPCQTDGLITYLGGNLNPNLFICDIICHGVPSPKLFSDYKGFLEKKFASKIKSFTFRDKKYGWKQTIKVQFSSGKNYIMSRDYDPYYRLFAKNYALRPSCSKCNYSDLCRKSDITIGDYWGIQKVFPEFYDKNGNSLVFLNTDKGKFLFNQILDKIDFIESNCNDCMQPNLNSPSIFPNDYNDFWKDYLQHGFIFICKKYGEYTIVNKLKSKLKKFLAKLNLLNF